MRMDSVKKLFDEIFYDWGMTPNPQIHKDNDYYWINKTTIDSKNFTLTYKRDLWKMEPEVLEFFIDFYMDYENDSDFEKILYCINDNWFNYKIIKNVNSWKLGSFKLYKQNFKYFYHDGHTDVEIDKILYVKVEKLLSKCYT